MNTHRKVLPEEKIKDMFKGHIDPQTIELINEDMHCILVDKTSGEARIKVESQDPGQGIMALLRLVVWYSTTT